MKNIQSKLEWHYDIKTNEDFQKLIDDVQAGKKNNLDNWDIVGAFWMKNDEFEDVVYIEIGIPTLEGITTINLTPDCILFDAYSVDAIEEYDCEHYLDCEWFGREDITFDNIMEKLCEYANTLD